MFNSEHFWLFDSQEFLVNNNPQKCLMMSINAHFWALLVIWVTESTEERLYVLSFIYLDQLDINLLPYHALELKYATLICFLYRTWRTVTRNMKIDKKHHFWICSNFYVYALP